MDKNKCPKKCPAEKFGKPEMAKMGFVTILL
jgi:hypothetical protein